jgi:uncharacterized membrane protein YraQ (UPF0718 family)
MDLLCGIFQESFNLLEDMAFYLLLGFLFAGILKVCLSDQKIVYHFGKGKIFSSIKASLIGIPLPICSCGVIPAAVSLRRQGANKGATLSFLISTPVTGIDSLLATYALLGGLFTIFRVTTSFVIAVLCGIFANIFLKDEKNNKKNDILFNVKGNSCLITKKGIDKNLIWEQCLLTPSCGTGSLSVELSENVMHTLFQMSKSLRT